MAETKGMKTTDLVDDKDKVETTDVDASKAAVSEAPYPSQADLDAIRAGTYGRETRDLKAKKGKAVYETR